MEFKLTWQLRVQTEIRWRWMHATVLRFLQTVETMSNITSTSHWHTTLCWSITEIPIGKTDMFCGNMTYCKALFHVIDWVIPQTYYEWPKKRMPWCHICSQKIAHSRGLLFYSYILYTFILYINLEFYLFLFFIILYFILFYFLFTYLNTNNNCFPSPDLCIVTSISLYCVQESLAAQ